MSSNYFKETWRTETNLKEDVLLVNIRLELKEEFFDLLKPYFCNNIGITLIKRKINQSLVYSEGSCLFSNNTIRCILGKKLFSSEEELIDVLLAPRMLSLKSY
jgi:hypothetical protein